MVDSERGQSAGLPQAPVVATVFGQGAGPQPDALSRVDAARGGELGGLLALAAREHPDVLGEAEHHRRARVESAQLITEPAEDLLGFIPELGPARHRLVHDGGHRLSNADIRRAEGRAPLRQRCAIGFPPNRPPQPKIGISARDGLTRQGTTDAFGLFDGSADLEAPERQVLTPVRGQSCPLLRAACTLLGTHERIVGPAPVSRERCGVGQNEVPSEADRRARIPHSGMRVLRRVHQIAGRERVLRRPRRFGRVELAAPPLDPARSQTRGVTLE